MTSTAAALLVASCRSPLRSKLQWIL